MRLGSAPFSHFPRFSDNVIHRKFCLNYTLWYFLMTHYTLKKCSFVPFYSILKNKIEVGRAEEKYVTCMHIKCVDGAVEQKMKSAGVASRATITTLQVSSKKIFMCEYMTCEFKTFWWFDFRSCLFNIMNFTLKCWYAFYWKSKFCWNWLKNLLRIYPNFIQSMCTFFPPLNLWAFIGEL